MKISLKDLKEKHNLLFEGEDYSFYVLSENKHDKVPDHFHDDWDESWFVLEGKYNITTNKKTYVLEKGDFLEVDRKIIHSVVCKENNSKRIAIFKKGIEIINKEEK